MAEATLAGVRIAGISCAVPSLIEDVQSIARLYGTDEARKLSESTGIQSRHIASHDTCTSDLCHAAGNDLITRLDWDRDSIDACLLITQTPDYLLPATSCSLQSRLGLSARCAAFDVNLGCSGYVYGLWLASQMVATGFRRVLLLVGDTPSRLCRPEDRGTRPLFGDAGTATAIESDPTASPTHFVLGTDGQGAGNLIVPRGLFRDPRHFGDPPTEAPRDPTLFMDGAEIFTFTLQQVPPLVRRTLTLSGWTVDDVDAVVMHQANGFILNHLAKRMKIPSTKVPLSIADFGNTSSATIPLTMAACLSERLQAESLRIMMVGFGVGYSWGAAAMTCGPMAPLSILKYEESPSGRREERVAC